MTKPFRIRDVLPADKAACVSFVDALQKFEHVMEPDRRIDPAIGAEYYEVLMKRLVDNKGRIFIADVEGQAMGWAVLVVEELQVYLTQEERICGYVAELFVTESMRGAGVGKALLDACEKEARARGLRQMRIGVLVKNTRAVQVYGDAGFEPYSMELRKYL